MRFFNDQTSQDISSLAPTAKLRVKLPPSRLAQVRFFCWIENEAFFFLVALALSFFFLRTRDKTLLKCHLNAIPLSIFCTSPILRDISSRVQGARARRNHETCEGNKLANLLEWFRFAGKKESES